MIKTKRNLIFICGFNANKNLSIAYQIKEHFNNNNESTIIVDKNESVREFTNFLLKDNNSAIDSVEYLYLYQKAECELFVSMIKHIAEHNNYAHIVVIGKLFEMMSSAQNTQRIHMEFLNFGYKSEFYFLNSDISRGESKPVSIERRKYHRAREYFNKKILSVRKNTMIKREIV